MESNFFSDSPTIPRPLSYRTPKKKQASTMGDRFIPIRPTDSSIPEPSFEPRTPESLALEERLTTFTSKLTPYASAPATPRKMLFFGSSPKPRVFSHIENKHQNYTTRRKHTHVSLDSLRILDAPDVNDNFYNQVLTWSSTDRLSIALDHDDGSVIYSVPTHAPNPEEALTATKPLPGHNVCSLASMDEENTISGWNNGYIRIHQTNTNHAYHYESCVSSSSIHSIAVTSPHTILCGNATGILTAVDIRQQDAVTRVRVNHNPEAPGTQIPGLTYDGGHYLASGSDADEVSLWDIRALNSGPVHTHTTHTAAIKALEFWPQNTRYLISGGGTACKHLALWNTVTNKIEDTIHTGGQVTGMHCFKSAPHYFVTSHGYGDSSIKLWRIKNSKMILKSTSHDLGIRNSSHRTLCLVGSPNTHHFATVTSIETLRFFKAQGLPHEKKQSYQVMPGFSQEFSDALVIR